MKNLYPCLFIVVIIFYSCRQSPVTVTGIEGNLYAKNTVKVTYKAAADASVNFAWFIGDYSTENWTELPGIHTPGITLLTDYAGKYLKCEVTAHKEGKVFPPAIAISETPVTDQGNPNTDWFKDAGFGLMVHFLKAAYTATGKSKEWNTIVDSFDVETFARQCKETGVGYVLWALGQNDGYYNAPNEAYDRITGVNPGDLCSTRDLPADLIKALKRYNIYFMFYLPGNPPIYNEAVAEKFQYTYGKDSPTSQYTQACWESVIEEWSLRYGKDLYGWWFDGMYRGGIIETRSDMSLKHNIHTHTQAAKAGNPQRIITYNYGVDKIQSNSPYDDYTAGEENQATQIPEGRWFSSGIQWFHFTYLGKQWGTRGTKTPTEELTAWAEKVFEKEGVLCFDVHVDEKGEIDPLQVEQLKAVALILKKIKANIDHE